MIVNNKIFEFAILMQLFLPLRLIKLHGRLKLQDKN